jgi:translation initiation factor 2 alpha subunit (eIF-2alpha)
MSWTLEKQELDLKSFLMMMMIEDNKNDINNSLKEVQNTDKQVEDLNWKHKKNPLKIMENEIKEWRKLTKPSKI